jgi:AcrR family transcriptional regulator
MSTYSTGENTKKQIINAAGELVAEHGFSNVSTRAVAARAGANIGSIHYHFGSKDGLFEAVVEEAVGECMQVEYFDAIEGLGDDPGREELARVMRVIVSDEIRHIFQSGRPEWQSRVIYQLMQRDDHLFDRIRERMLEPELEAMGRFFKLIDPEMDRDTLFLNIIILKMPIYAHVDYMKAIQKMMGVDHYSEEYLKRMEDMLVKQSQRLLGLPEL